MLHEMTGLFYSLDKKEKRTFRIYVVLSVISPIVDLFSISMILPIATRMISLETFSLRLFLFTLGIGCLILLKGGMELYRTRISSRLVYYGAQELSKKVLDVILKEDVLEHYKKTSMQALTNVRFDTTTYISSIILTVQLAINIITISGYAVVMIVAAQVIGLLTVLCFFFLMILLYYLYKKQAYDLGKKTRKAQIKANGKVTMAYGAFKEIKIGNRSTSVLGDYDLCSKEYARLQSTYDFSKNLVGVVLQNLIQVVVFMILAMIMLLRVDASSLLASLLIYFTILIRMTSLPRSIVSTLINIRYSEEAIRQVRNKLEAYERLQEKESYAMAELREKKITLHKRISVRNLTFGYEPDHPILKNVSLDIQTGETVAVIGPTGAGKTTFLDLLLGLLTPQKGHIFYDDYDIVEKRDAEGLCRAQLGDIISYIPQTIFLNGETIRDNVVYLSDPPFDEEKIVSCLQCAQIWDDVMQMPDGLDSVVGENGTLLSGGQRQRIALAKALYKDFELLVLDEATAALDMETEQAIMASIGEAKNGKTLLLVTHRMSLAEECDCIYKIEDQTLKRIK